MANFALTAADVERLLAEPSDENRADTAIKISADLVQHDLSAGERKLAGDIIRILAKDAALIVRRAIAESMQHSKYLPYDIAEALAMDAAAIAVPLLEHSPMLSDPFLIRVIEARGAEEQLAIASRENLSDPVVTRLVETGPEVVAIKLAGNHSAKLDGHNIAYMLERFPNSTHIHLNLAARPAVPLHILEYLVAETSDRLRDKIRARPDYKPQMEDTLTDARERATLRAIGRGRTDAELIEVAAQLADSQRLTASLALRSLCTGDLRFFEACMAATAKIPLKNARALVHDQGLAGLQALYVRTGLNRDFLPAIRQALSVVHETGFDGGADDVARYRRRLAERILTAPQDMMKDDIEYLLGKFLDLGTAAPAA